MNGPIRTLVNVKYLPPNSSGNLMGRWKVGVDDQGVVLLLVRRKCDLDEVWVCACVLRDEILYFLHESLSFELYGEWYKRDLRRSSQRLLVG